MANRIIKLIKNTGIYALGDICPRLFSLLIFPIFITHLHPEQYGIINYVNTVDTFLSVISILSFNTFFMVYYYKVNGEDEKKRLMGNLSLFVFLFTLALTITLHLLGPRLFNAWGSNVNFYPYLSLGILANLFNVVTLLPTCLYRVQERPLPLTILNIIKSILILVGSTLAVTIIPGDAEEVLLARLCITVLFSIIFVWVTRKGCIINFNWAQLKKAFKFSLPLIPGSLAFYLFSLFDRILIDKYLTLTALGIYSTASTLAQVLNVISNGAYRAFEPFFFQTYGKDNFIPNFIKVRNMLLFSILFGSICIGLFSKEFFMLFASKDYLESYQLVSILLIGTAAYAMGIIYETIIIAQEKTLIDTIITFVGAGLSILLNVTFLEKWGVYTAATVFSFSFIVVLILKICCSKVRTNHFRPVLTSSLVFAVLLGINNFIPCDIDIWLLVIVKIILAVTLSCMALKLLNINLNVLYNSIKKRK